ncbi:Crp/Fnr family transcriptional regulator [Agrobacterium vitis]|uniref:Crp/Fnr family transcriptional regulator n=1 Tax=Agrobacterium vitis TaxID=373 RepID=UPI001F2AD551|nr:Crp/Fnr family transcriptional regulator [Agrobacterium vitis]
MFNRTALGEVSPVFPIDFLISAEIGSKSQMGKLVAPRTRVFLHDFPRSSEYLLQDGCIALYQSLHDGRRQILDILGPGSFLGLSIGSSVNCCAETLAFTQIQPVAQLTDHALGGALKHMLHRSQALVTLLGRKTAQEKVAFALLDLAERFARTSKASQLRKTTFRLFLTRADLADWLGLTLETVSRCLNSFKRSGILTFNHPEIITIADENALRCLASGQPSLAGQKSAKGDVSLQPS